MTGKVTVGLTSHWPCVTDSLVYPPIRAQGSTGDYGIFIFTFIIPTEHSCSVGIIRIICLGKSSRILTNFIMDMNVLDNFGL